MRVVQNRKASEKHYRRIDEVKPKTGVVRLIRLTEKQYNNIYMVTGESDYQEKTVGVNWMLHEIDRLLLLMKYAVIVTAKNTGGNNNQWIITR